MSTTYIPGTDAQVLYDTFLSGESPAIAKRFKTLCWPWHGYQRRLV